MRKHLKLIIAAFILLVVLLGFIISTQDPLDKIKQSRDKELEIGAAEFIQSTVVYYSMRDSLPWHSVRRNGGECLGMDSETIPTVSLSKLSSECVQQLVDTGGYAKDTLSAAQKSQLFVTSPNPHTKSNLDTVICFKPESKNRQKDKNTRYNKNATFAPDNTCIADGGRDMCYWCTQ